MFSVKILAQCLIAASLHNQIPPGALVAIMEVEGGRSGLEVKTSTARLIWACCKLIPAGFLKPHACGTLIAPKPEKC